MDRDSGLSKGFGFVEMSSPNEAEAAIRGMNGQSVDGRDMVVNIARPMEPRTGGGGFGGGAMSAPAQNFDRNAAGSNAGSKESSRGST